MAAERARVGGLFRSAALVAIAVSLVPLATAAARAHVRRGGGPGPATTLEWVGDIALSTERGLPPGGVEHALAPVRGLLRAPDLTLGNLEGTLSVGGTSKCGGIGGGTCFAFQAPPSTAAQLRGLGFDLVNQANNHSLDYGASGRAQTLAALRRAGIASTGLPGQITVVRVPAHRWHGMRRPAERIAFVGFAPYPSDADLLDIPAAQALVRRAARRAALVVVIIHAGAEGAAALHVPYGTEHFLGENRGDPRAFAHAVIDAGASIVLGSGPHVVRGIERYRHRLIAYSLGNFVGYHTLAGGGVLSDSGILRVTLGHHGRVLAARWIAIRLVDGLPRPDRTSASTNLVRRLSDEDFPRGHWTVGARGVFGV